MAFKGTRRRSAREIAEEIENAGGDLNAETGVEQTAYLARVLGEDAPLALDMLADILTESQFDAGELEREKGVILQEIGAVEDAPDDLVFESSPRRPGPTRRSGARFSAPARGSAASSARRSTAICATTTRAGATSSRPPAPSHEEIVAVCERRFAALGRETASPRPRRRAIAAARRWSRRRLGQTHIVVGFEGRGSMRRTTTPPMCSRRRRAGACRPGCSRKCAKSAASPMRSMRSTGPIGRRPVGLLRRDRAERTTGELMAAALDCLAQAAPNQRGEVGRAKAQMKVFDS